LRYSPVVEKKTKINEKHFFSLYIFVIYKLIIMTITTIELYRTMTEKLGESNAKIMTEFIETKIDTHLENKKEAIVLELQSKIAEAKVDLLRWTFGFFIVIMLSIVGLYFK
jgi:hypothetical protein